MYIMIYINCFLLLPLVPKINGIAYSVETGQLKAKPKKTRHKTQTKTKPPTLEHTVLGSYLVPECTDVEFRETEYSYAASLLLLCSYSVQGAAC